MPSYVARLSAPLLALALTVGSAAAQTPSPATPADPGWPRQFYYSGDSITIYQPQVDAWQDNLIRAHAAVAIKAPGMAEPTFGVMHVQGVTAVNKDTRLVDVTDIAVTNAKFPMAGTNESAFTAALTLVLPVSYNNVSLDRLELSLAANQDQQTAKSIPIVNSPPVILFSSQPSILITIDGAPKYVAVTGQPVMRVVNTTAFLARDAGDAYWLHVYDGYMTAAALAGPWTVAKKVPSAAPAAGQAAAKAGQVDMLTGAATDSSAQAHTQEHHAAGHLRGDLADGTDRHRRAGKLRGHSRHEPAVRLEHEHVRVRGGQHADRVRADLRPMVQRALHQGPLDFRALRSAAGRICPDSLRQPDGECPRLDPGHAAGAGSDHREPGAADGHGVS